MHNNIMAAGSKDRPPMLGPGRYSQWRSRFLRYIDTKPNGGGLKKCIINGPYVPTSVLIQAVPEAEGRPAVQQHTAIETVLNMTPENKEHFQSEKEAIFLLLTGNCEMKLLNVMLAVQQTEMWTAIEKATTGWTREGKDVNDILFWEFGRFTSKFGESMESYYSRFYKLMNELTRNNLQVTTMQVNVQFLQQLQPECVSTGVNDIRAERIAKSANLLALFAAAQPYSDNHYQAPKPQRKNTTSYSTRPISEEDSDPEQAQRDKDMQKNLALLAKNKTEDTTPRYNNDNQSGQFGNQRTMKVAGGRETVGSQRTRDEEIDEQELEAHYSFMAKIQEVLPEESSSTDQPLEHVQNHDENNVFANERRHSEQPESINDTYVLEKDDSNVTPDSSNICNNDNQVDQNAAECVDERVVLANLIVNLTLDTEENKTILKQLKKANASLTQELEECKTNLDETSRALGEATSCRDSCLIALQNKQNEFEKYKAFNDRTIDYDILQTKLNETLGLLARKDIDIKEGLKTKAYEISVVNQKHDELVKRSLLTKSQFEGQLKEKSKVISDLKVKEEKDIDKMIEMDKQLKFLNEIVYTRNHSIQTIHMLAPKCSTYNGRPTFANPREETMTLANESRSKLNKDYVKPYDYTRQNSL
ncbi:hypothetical protein Tco_0833378 [Tanacetum coccineum]